MAKNPDGGKFWEGKMPPSAPMMKEHVPFKGKGNPGNKADILKKIKARRVPDKKSYA